jgi:hypothetical protein
MPTDNTQTDEPTRIFQNVAAPAYLIERNRSYALAATRKACQEQKDETHT